MVEGTITENLESCESFHKAILATVDLSYLRLILRLPALIFKCKLRSFCGTGCQSWEKVKIIIVPTYDDSRAKIVWWNDPLKIMVMKDHDTITVRIDHRGCFIIRVL